MHNTGSGPNERVPCPIDPNHMVLKRDLEKHILRCNKIVENVFSSKQPFTVKGCNSSAFAEAVVMEKNLTSFVAVEICLWKVRLSAARAAMIHQIESRVTRFGVTSESDQSLLRWSDEVDACASELTNHGWESRDKIDKHNVQNACLLQVMNERGLAPKRNETTVFVELGCGKAGLTRWLINSLSDEEPDSLSAGCDPIFLLLDYEARRFKNENKKELRSKISPSNIIRLRSNIMDVDLSQFMMNKSSEPAPVVEGKPGSMELRLSELHAKVHAIQSRPSWPCKRIVGTAKHLCGAATDFGLRCLSRVKDKQVSLVFATCCHHRCDWDQLVNQKSFIELGVCANRSEFQRMISMAGWATTGGIDEERRQIGRLVKSVIDLSRIVWLTEQFPQATAVEYRKYIEDGITPENFCIVLSS